MKQQKTVITWALQILIIAVLIGFALFVFYGPTGWGTSDQNTSWKNSGKSVQVALFTAESAENSGNPAISYTKEQIRKVTEAAKKAGIKTLLMAPKKGIGNDYLKEIRVFQDKHIVQLLYPHFGIMESVHRIQPEPHVTKTEKTTLNSGSARWVTFKHGGIHLYFHRHHTYIVMDSTKIHTQSRLKSIAESFVPVQKLN